jgi:hypothetical protein
MFPGLTIMAYSSLLTGNKEAFQVLRQEFSSPWKIPRWELVRGNAVLDCAHGHVEDLRNVADRVCGLEKETLDLKDFLEHWVCE